MEDRLPRKLAAILYADVAGYSRLTGEDEEGTHRRLSEYLDLISVSIEKHQGKVVHYAGDAVLADFGTVTGALTCAAAVQRDLQERNKDLPHEHMVEFRIGVNLGEVIEDRNDIYGDGVNVAARLESLADSGGICISESVRTAVGNRLSLDYEFLGEQRVKNITEPVRAYRVILESAEARVTPREPVPLELPDKPSIAVLPFDNMSGDPKQDFVCDGIAEDLITALSKIRAFSVIARNSTFVYKNSAVDVRQVAADLGVRYVLEGSVRRSGRRIRVTAQLIDADTGHHLWAERYDREFDDLFDLQDEMTQTIAGAMEPELNAAERGRAVSKPPGDCDTWELYQRALWHMWKYEEDAVNTAIEMFQQVNRADPNFAPAWAYLAYSRYVTVVQGWADDPDARLAEGLEAATTGILCDENDAIPYFAAGRIYMMMGEHDNAVASLNRSLEIDPSFAKSYHGLGFALALAGRADEAKQTMQKAITLSPREPMLWAFTIIYAFTCLMNGDNEEALEWAQRTLRNPKSTGYWPHAIFAAAAGNLEQIDKARQALATACKENPSLSIAFLRKNMPTKFEGGLDPYLNGLRKAGLSE